MAPVHHDIVTIGASAGGLEVLLDLVKGLPADLAAAVFVVVHMSPGHSTALPDLLNAHGPLPARMPVHQRASCSSASRRRPGRSSSRRTTCAASCCAVRG